MVNQKYITIPQLAKLLGLSRIEVYRKVRKGQVKAEKIGRMYIITDKEVAHILGKQPTAKDKRQIERAVKKAVKDYGEVLRKLGEE
ncbi:MAG: helix-turn-helix domain-containing protein [Bacteroidota bacterium]